MPPFDTRSQETRLGITVQRWPRLMMRHAQAACCGQKVGAPRLRACTQETAPLRLPSGTRARQSAADSSCDPRLPGCRVSWRQDLHPHISPYTPGLNIMIHGLARRTSGPRRPGSAGHPASAHLSCRSSTPCSHRFLGGDRAFRVGPLSYRDVGALLIINQTSRAIAWPIPELPRDASVPFPAAPFMCPPRGAVACPVSPYCPALRR